MKFNKNTDIKTQMDEVIQSLRKKISREYRNPNSGNLDYIENIKQIRSTKIETLRLKSNFVKKLFHSSSRLSDLAYLAQKTESYRQENKKLIDENPRVQLAQTIKDSFKSPETTIPVFAIEQLMKNPQKLDTPAFISQQGFYTNSRKTKRGIHKLKKKDPGLSATLLEKIENLESQYGIDQLKASYSDLILNKLDLHDPNLINSYDYSTFIGIHTKNVTNTRDTNQKLNHLTEEVLQQLQQHNITSGLDSKVTTFIKTIMAKVRNSFSTKNKLNTIAPPATPSEKVPTTSSQAAFHQQYKQPIGPQPFTPSKSCEPQPQTQELGEK